LYRRAHTTSSVGLENKRTREPEVLLVVSVVEFIDVIADML
jgi:hypothetical protein